jgi:hypothetical protein
VGAPPPKAVVAARALRAARERRPKAGTALQLVRRAEAARGGRAARAPARLAEAPPGRVGRHLRARIAACQGQRRACKVAKRPAPVEPTAAGPLAPLSLAEPIRAARARRARPTARAIPIPFAAPSGARVPTPRHSPHARRTRRAASTNRGPRRAPMGLAARERAAPMRARAGRPNARELACRLARSGAMIARVGQPPPVRAAAALEDTARARPRVARIRAALRVVPG